jgi:hypothetical protein
MGANLIEAAVLPLKVDAMQRAEEYAREIISKTTQELEAAGFDLEVAAPFPSSYGYNRFEYEKKHAEYFLFQKLTTWRKSSYSNHEPHLADMDLARCEKFVKEARENAAAQYDAYVAKLNKKIGEVTLAVLEGNHVWSYSILRVATTAGEKQSWKTTMIVNQSKYGKVFNQFPTRRIKE